MKKLVAIALILCLASLSSKADEIKDKDFQQFFAEFQKELKKSKGDPWTFNNYIDCSPLVKKYNSDPVENQSCIHVYVTELLYFASIAKNEYTEICSLSSKNKYSVNKKNKHYSWKITYNADQYIYKKYGVHSVYKLQRDYDDGEDEEAFWCVFSKINGAWKIIDFDGAG